MADFFEDDDYFTGPKLTDEMVESAEKTLGYKLPERYIELLKTRNGGSPRRSRLKVDIHDWGIDGEIAVDGILGIGGEWGVVSDSGLGSKYIVSEWGYPDIGVVFCALPSGGHDSIMLDYSGVDTGQEPAVAYVNEHGAAVRIASSFGQFVDELF